MSLSRPDDRMNRVVVDDVCQHANSLNFGEVASNASSGAGGEPFDVKVSMKMTKAKARTYGIKAALL